MANLIKLSNDLEYVPKDQLIQMSQNPDNNYPSYLVLAEIQRRTQNEKAYAAQQPQPETTVAEEVVQEYASSPQGLGAMTQPSGGNLSTPDAEGNMAPPSPMMQAASGGLTGYAEGGITGYQTGGQLTTEELRQQFLQGEQGAQGSGVDLSQTYTPQIQNNDIPEDVLEEVESIASSKGADFLKFAGVLKEDGSIDPLGATLAVASLHPIGRAAGWAGKAGYNLGKKYLPGIASGLKGIVKKSYDKLLTKPGLVPGKVVRQNNSQPLGQAAKDLGLGRGTTNTMVTGNVFSPGKAIGLGTSIALPAGIIKNISDSAQENYTPEVNNESSDNESSDNELTKDQLRIAELEKLLLQKNTTSSDRGNADMLVGLGGAIMKSNTIGELGGNISDSYTNVRNKKDANKLAGLQGRMMEAQITKAETELANMPEQRLIQQYGFIEDAINAHKDGTSILDEVTLTKYIKQKDKLLQQIMAYGNVAQTGGDILDKREIA